MISNPRNGWSTFRLGDFFGTPSYLTNVPVDLLEEFIHYWKESRTLSVYFDEEGSTFTLVANPDSIYIIEEKEEPKLININRNIKSLTFELINDIEKDIDKWASEFVIAEEDVAENKDNILSLLSELKTILKEKKIKAEL